MLPSLVICSASTMFGAFCFSLFFAAVAVGETGPEWERPPGWTTTRGGEGGSIIKVTNLSPEGPGSLAEALATEGARNVVFTVGGTIDLGGRRLSIRDPQVTIAGESAPSPGITIVQGGISISAPDVILRHLRVRVGEAGHAKRSGWEVDGIATSGTHDVIIDHCSISWATDENLSASGPRFKGTTPDEWRRNTSHRITFSQCIVGESLRDSTHAKGPHSMGSLIHDNASDIAIIGNLYISNNARNPLFKGGARGAVINNLIHNPGSVGLTYGLQEVEWEGHPWQRGVLVVTGNVVRQGPSTSGKISFARFRGPCDAYLHDNLLIDHHGQSLLTDPMFTNQANEHSATPLPGEFRACVEPPFWPTGLKAKLAGEVEDWVLKNAGARPWDRDAVDNRLVEEARTGRGKIIDSEKEVEGYKFVEVKP